MSRADEITEEIERLSVVIAEASARKSALRNELNALRRVEVERRRQKLKAVIGLSKREHAQEGGYLMTQECRDLCWVHNLPYVSNEKIGQLISSGRIEGHQYKGGYFATKDAVMKFIEAETADPESVFFELPDGDEDLASSISQ